jgi:phosphatidylserine decarboxylase
MTLIDGEYYTVNPQAIRTHLDVYGENVRKVVPVISEEFGTVMTVWVGAMSESRHRVPFCFANEYPSSTNIHQIERKLTRTVVGSIATTVEEGQMVERGDEMGYFAFGGSTIVCLFEKGVLEWDEDLKENGQAAVETLVRMGMGIGTATAKAKDGASASA